MVLLAASFPLCPRREGRGELGRGRKKRILAAAAAACGWGWLSAALARVFNVSAWNVLNTTFYKGTLVKHLH